MDFSRRLSKSEKYLLGVSGGSDSMMLLDLCAKQGFNVVVAHVNYKHRPTADRDENIVKDYCDKHNIKVYCCYPSGEEGNFQKWAREVRYQFYKEVYLKEDCDALLLGHQLDDRLENYLMAKQRGSATYHYGIKEETFHHCMRIIRPLLSIRKKDTSLYCQGNNITYGDDESNFTDDYQRNRIRHHLVELASEKQIETWINDMDELNKEIDEKISDILTKYDLDKPINRDEFVQEKDQNFFIRYYLNHYLPEDNFSGGLIEELVKIVNTSSKNSQIKLTDDYLFIYEYGHFYVMKIVEDYSFTVNSIEEAKKIDSKYFKISDKGEKIQQLSLTESDFPITIRNSRANDIIELRYGSKKVNRAFIDKKISYYKRKSLPVVENKDKKVIFVALIGCDKYHFSIKPDIFVIE